MSIWRKMFGKKRKSPTTAADSSGVGDSEARVDYEHIRRLCSGSSAVDFLEGDFGQDTPPRVFDQEGEFQPTLEEIQLAREARASELKGNQYMDTGRFKEAISYFEQAAKIARADGILYQNIAVAYHQLGNLAEARRAIREALRREPSNLRIQKNAEALGVSKEEEV